LIYLERKRRKKERKLSISRIQLQMSLLVECFFLNR